MKIFKRLSIGAIALIALSLPSCKTNKGITDKGIDKNADLPKLKTKAEDYYKNAVVFKTFNGKASMNYQDKKQSHKLTSTIKMNDEIDIWASISAVGGIVEVARAYITPDSLQAMVPLSRDAYKMAYKEGLALIQAELDFNTLQNLFIGNALILNAKPKKIEEKDDSIIIQIEQDGYLLSIVYDSKTGTISQQEISHAGKNFYCKITQTNYKPQADKQPFSYTRNLTITKGNDELKLEMNFSKAEIDLPLDIKFRIPDSYTIKKP